MVVLVVTIVWCYRSNFQEINMLGVGVDDVIIVC